MERQAVVTTDPEQTRRVAAVVAAACRPGDVVALAGDLGAGKTCFVQGAAASLGVERRVTSPTFMLVRTYPEATPPLVHADVYRLGRLHDVLDLGDEVFAPDAVTFLEWADAVTPLGEKVGKERWAEPSCMHHLTHLYLLAPNAPYPCFWLYPDSKVSGRVNFELDFLSVNDRVSGRTFSLDSSGL